MARRTAWRRAFAAATALSTAACAAPLMKLPAGPGLPAPDAADALSQATATCRGIKTLTADIGISGSAGGRRVRGRLLAGAAAPASVRLEALAPFGAPIFLFVAAGDDATLLLPRDDRVLEHGRPGAVLDAAVGVPVDASDLVTTLAGCAPPAAASPGLARGADWRVVALSAGQARHELYLHRDGAGRPWRLVATIREGATDGAVRTEYRDFQNGLPRTIHIRGLDREPFDLTLVLSQVETNVPLEPDVFRLEIPRSAGPITLEELRRARLGIRED